MPILLPPAVPARRAPITRPESKLSDDRTEIPAPANSEKYALRIVDLLEPVPSVRPFAAAMAGTPLPRTPTFPPMLPGPKAGRTPSNRIGFTRMGKEAVSEISPVLVASVVPDSSNTMLIVWFEAALALT